MTTAEQVTEHDSTVAPVTSIVLPTYNEEANIDQLVEELDAVIDSASMMQFRPVEIIFVDGGSTDGTRKRLQSLTAQDDRITALFLQKRFGQSPALAAGFNYASGQYIVPMDADGQNDPADIPDLLTGIVDGADCVSGWRRDREDPWHKTIPSAIQTRLATLTGPDIHDFGCTLKAYRAEALTEIDLYGEGHRYIPAKLHKLGYDIEEREVNHRPREHGKSRYGVGRLIRGFVDLWFHVFWNRYSSRPLHLLGGAGILLIALGGVIGGHAVLLKYLFGTQLVPRLPRLILTSLLVIVGLQMVMLGTIAEMLTKLYYRDDHEYRVEEIVMGGGQDA